MWRTRLRKLSESRLHHECGGSLAGSTCVISTLDVREFGGDFAIANGEDVYAAQMPGLAVAELAIDPQHCCAITGDDHVFSLEVCVGVAREPTAPERDDGGFTFNAVAVRGGRGVLEDRVVGEQRSERVGVVAG